MDINILDNRNINLENERNIVNEENQNKFIDSLLGQTINTAVDIGLRAILPDQLENTIINVKDILLEEGLKEGFNKIVNSAIDVGKSAIGIFTGKFENISQVQTAIKKGGIIDSTSDLIDTVVEKAQKNKLIDKNISKIIKQGKNIILNNLTKNIEDTMTEQINSIENINKYTSKWNEYYNSKDFDNMDKYYKKIEKELEKTIPLENTIKQARKIENLHNLIKNNGKNFNISEVELELAKKLV